MGNGARPNGPTTAPILDSTLQWRSTDIRFNSVGSATAHCMLNTKGASFREIKPHCGDHTKDAFDEILARFGSFHSHTRYPKSEACRHCSSILG